MTRGGLAALLLAATQAWGAEAFVCKPDQAIGFVHDGAAGQWQARVFADPGRGWVVREVTDDERRVMGLAPRAFVVQIEGQAQIEHVCGDGFTLHGDLRCERERVSSFSMGNKTLRYLYVLHDGYWSRRGRPASEDSPIGMEIGRCRAL
jgi:hypothetical protein